MFWHGLRYAAVDNCNEKYKKIMKNQSKLYNKVITTKTRRDGLCSKRIKRLSVDFKSNTLTLFNHGNVRNLLILDNIKVIVILMPILNVCVYCHTVHMCIL